MRNNWHTYLILAGAAAAALAIGLGAQASPGSRHATSLQAWLAPAAT
jgi:hypothetical protein